MRPAEPVSAAPPKVRTPVDADLLHATNQFLHAWLVSDNFNQAALYFSSHSYDCVIPMLPAGAEEPKTAEQYLARIQNGLTVVGKEVGPVHHLRDAVEPMVPDHDDLKIVSHPEHDAYTVIAVPDSLAESFSCQKRTASHPYQAPSDNSQAKTYGKLLRHAVCVADAGRPSCGTDLSMEQGRGPMEDRVLPARRSVRGKRLLSSLVLML